MNRCPVCKRFVRACDVIATVNMGEEIEKVEVDCVKCGTNKTTEWEHWDFFPPDEIEDL